MPATLTHRKASAMPTNKPTAIAVPRVTVEVDTVRDRYSVNCAECGLVDVMWTALGAADMRGLHRRLHIANRLGLTAR